MESSEKLDELLTKKFDDLTKKFDELEERIQPPIRLIVETIYGRYTNNNFFITLETVITYKGWIDGFRSKDTSEDYYFTIFDKQTEYGRELSEKFAQIPDDEGIIHFKPTKQFQVSGKVIAKGYINDFGWAVLKVK